MDKSGTGQITWLRLTSVVAALAIMTCATPALAQATAVGTKTEVKEKPVKSSGPRIKRNVRATTATKGANVMGPPAPSTARKAAPRRAPNIPEPTVTLKPGEVPSIEFDTPKYNFGRVEAGGDVVHDFWFTNRGTGPLEILSVKPG